MQPVAFFVLPRGWKRSQWHFSFFQGVGSAIFCVFWFSKGLEMLLTAFSILPRGWKRNFPRFLIFQGVGNTPDRVFRSSQHWEDCFYSLSRGLILHERADGMKKDFTMLTPRQARYSQNNYTGKVIAELRTRPIKTTCSNWRTAYLCKGDID